MFFSWTIPSSLQKLILNLQFNKKTPSNSQKYPAIVSYSQDTICVPHILGKTCNVQLSLVFTHKTTQNLPIITY
jgi:hypothetical protein